MMKMIIPSRGSKHQNDYVLQEYFCTIVYLKSLFINEVPNAPATPCNCKDAESPSNLFIVVHSGFGSIIDNVLASIHILH